MNALKILKTNLHCNLRTSSKSMNHAKFISDHSRSSSQTSEFFKKNSLIDCGN